MMDFEQKARLQTHYHGQKLTRAEGKSNKKNIYIQYI